MPRSQYLNLRVGILMASGLVLLMFAIMSVGSGSKILSRTTKFETHFHRTNGLQTGAPVTSSGVTIGAVDSISFPDNLQLNYVVVRVWVESNVAPRIHTDSEAHIRTMGLLGDKFVDISTGTPSAPTAPDQFVLRSQDPLDYEALLGQKGTGDFFVNIMEASLSVKNILESIDKGNGLLSQVIHGEGHGKQADQLQQTLNNINLASHDIQSVLQRINQGEGLAGALTVNNEQSKNMMANLAASAQSARLASERLDRLVKRFEQAEGMLPRMMEDRQLATNVLRDLQGSTRDLNDILRKVNSGEGSLGKLVNDPTLYNEARNLVGGAGMGMSLLKGVYKVTHPFGGSSSAGSAQQSQQTPAGDGSGTDLGPHRGLQSLSAP